MTPTQAFDAESIDTIAIAPRLRRQKLF